MSGDKYCYNAASKLCEFNDCCMAQASGTDKCMSGFVVVLAIVAASLSTIYSSLVMRDFSVIELIENRHG